MLRLENAERAVYVDFEGPGNGYPVLIGAHTFELATQKLQTRHYVFDSALKSAAENHGNCIYVEGIDSAISLICDYVQKFDKNILAWSMHEAKTVQQHPEITNYYKQIWNDHYIDAKKIAKKSTFGAQVRLLPRDPRAGRHRLVNYTRLMGIPMVRGYGHLQVGNRIRDIKGQLERRGTYRSITPVAKRKWIALIKHNAWDIESMREVIINSFPHNSLGSRSNTPAQSIETAIFRFLEENRFSTAREIAKNLDLPKRKINPILYRNLDHLFRKYEYKWDNIQRD